MFRFIIKIIKFMGRKKKIQNKVAGKPAEAVSGATPDLERAKFKLARFELRKKEAKTPEQLKEALFWIAHLKRKITDLSK